MKIRLTHTDRRNHGAEARTSSTEDVSRIALCNVRKRGQFIGYSACARSTFSREQFAMSPDAVARSMAYAIDEPDDVNIGESVVRPADDCRSAFLLNPSRRGRARNIQAKREVSGRVHRVPESSPFYPLRPACPWETQSVYRAGRGVPALPFSERDLGNKTRSLSP
jgi:hypothetical protein